MHIGEMLVQTGTITTSQLESALAYQKSIGGRLGQILIKLGIVGETTLLRVLSEQLDVPIHDLAGFEPDPELMKRLPQEVMERLNALPIRQDPGVLVVGVSDPTDFNAQDELRLHAGENVEVLLVSPSRAKDLLNRFFHPGDDQPQRRHRRGRDALTELVRELGEDAQRQAVAPALSDLPADLERFTTRQLIAGLISALDRKHVISTQELVQSLNEAVSNPAAAAEESGA